MAQREALRELQSRLALRLRAARSEPPTTAWLAVECAGHGLLFPLATAGEIFPLTPLLPVPHTQPWFAGVASLRGVLHGVVDLAAFLGLRSAGLQDAAREQAQMVALNGALGSHAAVLIDRLAGLRSAGQLVAAPDDAAEVDVDVDADLNADLNGADPIAVPAPATAPSRPAFAPRCWRDADGRRWQEIDLAALARHEMFLDIAA